MSGTVSTRWYFPDWLSEPGLRVSSLAARGLWMDLLCIAAANKGRDHGFVIVGELIPTVTVIARAVGATPEEVGTLLNELESNGVFNRDKRGAIYCRRMVRAEKNRSNGRLGGNPNLQKEKKNQKSVGQKPKAHIPVPIPVPVEDSLFPEPESDWPKDYREQFWKRYPRHTAKQTAMKKLEAVRKSAKVSWVVMTAGLQRYVEHLAVNATEERFTKHAATWLNGGCWDDEFKPNGGGFHEAGGGRTGLTFASLAVRLQRGLAERAASGDATEGEPDHRS